jgi:putative ABC transport system permease protein
MRSLLSHFRTTMRRLLKSPGFTIIAVLVLGLGIGVNAAIFSLIDTVLIKPLPYPESDRVMMVFLPSRGVDQADAPIDYPDYLDLQAAQHTFTSISIEYAEYFDRTENGSTERMLGAYSTSNFIQSSGLQPFLGRFFTADEDKAGGPLVTVLSERYWRSHYHADPTIIGKSVILNGQSFMIIGVVPGEAENRYPPNLYVPLNTADVIGAYYLWNGWRKRDDHNLYCIGRLKPGVTQKQAQADLDVIYSNLIAKYPEDQGFAVRVESLMEFEMKDYAGTVWILGAAVGCLLIISSANVATLLLARALDRKQEITIRATLGASRFRLAAELMTESIMLSFFGGVLGVGVALWVIEVIKAIAPEDMPRVFAIGLDGEALLFFFLAAAIAALLSGLLPAVLTSRTNVTSTLTSGGIRSTTPGPDRQRAQSSLMVGQVAMACVMLIAAGLLVRSLQAAKSIPLGFNAEKVFTAHIYLTDKQQRDATRTQAFFQLLLDRIRRFPGVVDVALNNDPPFYWEDGYDDSFVIPSQPPPPKGQEPRFQTQNISPKYFQTLHIPLLGGRDFNADDRTDRQSVVIINKSLAQRFFPSQDPVGKEIENVGLGANSKTSTIIGIADNVAHSSPGHHPSPFVVYYPFNQQPERFEILLARTVGDPAGLASAVREAVASIDSTVPVSDAMTYDDLISSRFSTRRVGVVLVSCFSAAALLLSATGLYGVLAYSVSKRSREMGIRVAVGADRRQIVRLVVSQGLRLLGIGLLIGIAGSLVAGKSIESLLYGISPVDLLTVAVAIIVLGVTGLLACLFPAIRASRIDPIIVLKA